jgi:hypothetical protein
VSRGRRYLILPAAALATTVAVALVLLSNEYNYLHWLWPVLAAVAATAIVIMAWRPAVAAALCVALAVPAVYSATVWEVPVNGPFPVAGPYIYDNRETLGIPLDEVASREIAQRGPGGEQAARWVSLADRIVADTAAHALHPSGRWQRSPNDPRPDAALLLPAIRGAIPASDPRSIATLDAITSELTQDGYCYRYRPDQRPLGESEGAFLLCGFWMALAYARQGDHLTAARWFERNRAACGPPGLFSEEFDVTQRQLRGNLPQAFVHAVFLECAVEQYAAAERE